MTHKHTPGPWHRSIKPARKHPAIWSGRDKHVAYVTSVGLSEEEVEANINLIAAAPEMLEALENVQALIVEGAAHGFRYDVGDWAERLYESNQKTSAAIKKATGQ